VWQTVKFPRKEVDIEEKENVPPDSVVLAPGVVSSYKNGWRQLWKYFLELFLIGIIYAVITSPGRTHDASNVGDVLFGDVLLGTGLFGLLFSFGLLGVVIFAYHLLIAGPVEYGTASAYLKAARGDKLEVKDMFAAFQNYWNAVLANMLVGIIVLVGFILLIVPGIIFACKLAFVHYLVVDQKMEAIEAVKESWRLTNGHTWQVFLIGLMAIPISIAGLLCFGVGIFVAMMWVSLAFASLYHAVSLSAEASG